MGRNRYPGPLLRGPRREAVHTTPRRKHPESQERKRRKPQEKLEEDRIPATANTNPNPQNTTNHKKGEVRKMVLNELQETIEKIREHPAADDLPDAFWEEINSVEDWEVYSSEEGLPVLANFDDPEFNQMVDEVYDNGMTIAEVYEFSEKIAEDPEKTPQEGPTIEVETSEGVVRVYPVWEKHDSIYTLSMISDDEYIDAELLILSNKDIQDIDIEEAIVEAIRSWVRGE